MEEIPEPQPIWRNVIRQAMKQPRHIGIGAAVIVAPKDARSMMPLYGMSRHSSGVDHVAVTCLSNSCI